MPKKKPSLKKQTAWAEARAAYAGCVLAGVVIVKRVRSSRMTWPTAKREWFIESMPQHIKNYGKGPYITRGAAVAAAINHLENVQ